MNGAKGGKCAGMKMCCGHLLQSGSGKQQLLFPLLDCLSHKLLNIGLAESFPPSFIHFLFSFCFFGRGGETVLPFFRKRCTYVFFDLKICLNNKRCQRVQMLCTTESHERIMMKDIGL